MGYHPYEVASNPELHAKFNEIVEYFAPYEDKTFLLQKLSRGQTKDNAVEHVWRYVNLRKDYTQTKEKYDSLTKELERYER